MPRKIANFCLDDESKKCSNKKETAVKIATIRKMSVLDIISQVIILTSKKEISFKGIVLKYLKVLSEKLDISVVEALLLSAFVEQSDEDNIHYRDIARHFGNCPIVEIIKYKGELDEMVRKGIIIEKRERGGNTSYRMPHSTIDSLFKNTLPNLNNNKSTTLSEWVESIDELITRIWENELNDDDFEALIKDNFKNNQHLECVRKIEELKLESDDLKLFLTMSMKCIIYDNDITDHDISGVFSKYKYRFVRNRLAKGNHYLMENNLIEHSCSSGQANPQRWCLTSYSKSEIFGEFELDVPNVSSSLKPSDSIVEKKLYYDDEVSRQVESLESMLEPERMNRILKRMSENGMRKGFACLFYGGPGTGKTETVLQLARKTGRSIIQVDITTIRDKWVGETEKRIKACFDAYRKHAQKCEVAPILFFNEADALFTTRNENASSGVDKMENAMQNIILQEMETLEGILIATTNLTGVLDPAFERRFLFKIEFTKPSAEVRRHIWQSMLPDLSNADAVMLARVFEFSGGQIENITRKRLIDEILNGNDTMDIDTIVEICKHEKIDKSRNSRIGFCL